MGLNLKSAPATFKTDKPMYKPYKSSKAGKDGMVYVKSSSGGKRLLHFGDSSMARSAAITDKSGKKTASNKNTANYWSRRNWQNYFLQLYYMSIVGYYGQNYIMNYIDDDVDCAVNKAIKNSRIWENRIIKLYE